MKKEYCFLCGGETEKAGCNDDSIFVYLQKAIDTKKIGDEIGPLCNECYDALLQINAVKSA